jgi:DHA1 family bicyclomycin/chloramphenicol resistance-like MFS transporter
MHRPGSHSVTIISALSTSLVLMSSHLYIPALPVITVYFGIPADLTQMTLPFNLLGICLSGLIYGPISDVYGRRFTLLIGLTLFLIFTISCIFSPNIYVMILFRFLQGCGGGACMTLALVMIKDFFPKEQCTQMLSRIAVVLTVTPALSPIIGGYLTAFLGWQSTFISMALLGSFIFVLVIYKLPETLEARGNKIPSTPRQFLALGSIFRPYFKILRDKRFISYAIVYSLPFAGQWCFLAAAPFIFINQLNVPTASFGYYMSSVTVLYILSSLMIQYIAPHIGSQRLIKWGLKIGILSSSLFLVVAITLPSKAMLLTSIMSFYVSAIAFTTPAATTKALETHEENKGISASLLSSTRIAAGCLGSFIAGMLEDINFIKVGCFMVTCILICLYTHYSIVSKTS